MPETDYVSAINIHICRSVVSGCAGGYAPGMSAAYENQALVFVEARKLESPEKTLGARTRTNNKLNPHMTPGHIGKRRALSPLCHPCSPKFDAFSERKHWHSGDGAKTIF